MKKKIKEIIEEIQIKENLTLSEVFRKYPHLEKLQKEELFEMQSLNEKKLLKG